MEAIPARRALSKVDFLIFVPLPPDDNRQPALMPAACPGGQAASLNLVSASYWNQLAARELSGRTGTQISAARSRGLSISC